MSDSQPRQEKSWNGLKAWSQLIAATLIPLALALIGHLTTNALATRETSLKYVELAISILNDDPKEQTRNLRSWAVDILNRHSEVRMASEAREALIRRVPLRLRADRIAGAEVATDELDRLLLRAKLAKSSNMPDAVAAAADALHDFIRRTVPADPSDPAQVQRIREIDGLAREAAQTLHGTESDVAQKRLEEISSRLRRPE
ncbi:MAG: hypothetical protein JSV91_12505 [Phycisphaerales bacterium]|nr:MAG: hypothetical protein JSV91_12505 [Phycisphaerales bacterium]